jgi:A-factor biosynthesis hotdog protein
MTALVSEQFVHDVELVSAVWSGRLDVRSDDPYHFDHPLDHVPGMALIGGLLELVRRSGAADLELPARRLGLAIAFPSFCELDAPVMLQAVRIPVGEPGVETALTLLAEQDDRVVCEADLTVRHASAASAQNRGVGGAWLTADQTVVHRHRRENVFVTGMAERDDYRVAGIRPAVAGHALAVEPGAPYRAEFLVDAARQFCTMICHLEHDRPTDTVFVMSAITADLPCWLGTEAYLRWSVAPPGRGQLRLTAGIVAGDPDGAPCGSVEFDYFAVTPAVYRRLRGDVRAAA